MSSLVQELVSLQSLEGPLLIGQCVNWGLLGALAIQVYIYTLAFPKDSNFMKVLVGWVFLLDLIHTGFTSHLAWNFLVERQFLQDSPATVAVPLLSAFVAFSVQLFFVWRIWKLAALYKIVHFTMIGLITTIALLSFIGAFWSGIGAGSVHSTDDSTLSIPITMWMAGSIAADVMITMTIIVQLLLRRSGDVFSSKTNQIVHRTIRMTVETGALTAAVAIALYAWSGNAVVSGADFSLGYIVSKLYSNSLLASLNSRASLFRPGSDDIVTSGTSIWNAGPRSTDQADENSVEYRGLKDGEKRIGTHILKSPNIAECSDC